MYRKSNIGFAVLVSVALMLSVVVDGHAAELRFEHVMNIGSEGSGPGQFKYVEDFAFTKDGHLLATDAANSNVQVFDKSTGKYMTQFAGKGDGDEHLEKPEGIAVDPDGNIFVADYTTGYVKIYDKNYKWKKTFSEYGAGPGQNIKSEFMDVYDGKLYMAKAGNHRVNVFDLQGNFLFMFGGSGTEPGKLNVAEASKVNSQGKVYVTDLKNDRIQVFNSDGTFIKLWGKTGSAPGDFKTPAGLAIDKHDNIYVTEIGNDRVEEIVSSVQKVSDIVVEIASASQEQGVGIEQVNKAVVQMEEATQRNAALTEETAAASASLSEQARGLDDLIVFFKVDGVSSHLVPVPDGLMPLADRSSDGQDPSEHAWSDVEAKTPQVPHAAGTRQEP
jgi:DNA-binding beta-propeller fold protein YncE